MEIKSNQFTWVNGEEEILVEVVDKTSYSNIAAICERVVEEMFKDGKYRPYMREVVLYSCLLNVYTNINIENLDDMMMVLENTELIQFMGMIDDHQLDKINEYIDEMVKYRLSKTGVDRMIDAVIEMVKDGRAAELINEFMEDVQSVNN